MDQVPYLRRTQQGFGRNTAPVEADPAERLALDDHGVHAELRGADRGGVAARSTAYL